MNDTTVKPSSAPEGLPPAEHEKALELQEKHRRRREGIEPDQSDATAESDLPQVHSDGGLT